MMLAHLLSLLWLASRASAAPRRGDFELQVPPEGIESEVLRPRPLIRRHLGPGLPPEASFHLPPGGVPLGEPAREPLRVPLKEASEGRTRTRERTRAASLLVQDLGHGSLSWYLWVGLLSSSLGAALTGLSLWRGFCVEVAAEELVPPRPGHVTSVFQILCITSLNIGYGAMAATMAIFVLPKEAEQFFPKQSSLGLGLLELLGASSLLLGPLAGQLSDRTKHTLGRRRPMVLISTQLAMIATLGCWLASISGSSAAFGLCFLVQQVMWNGGHAAHAALLSDVVHPGSIGLASSLQAITMLLGALLGMLCFQALASEGLHYSGIYGLQVMLGFAFLPVVQLSAGEAPSSGMLLPGEPLSFSSAFRLGEERSPDFRLVMWEKAIYCICAGAKSFILFFVRDVLHITRGSDQALLLAEAALSNVTAAAAGGFLSSWLFTRFHIQAQRLAFAGSVLLAVGTQFWICAFFSPGLFSKTVLLGFFAVYGFGQGCYMSADLALAIDTLPDPDEASRYLGLWGLSAFLGAGVGGLAMSFVLELFGKTLPETYGIRVPQGRYCLHGYIALLLAGCVCHLYVGKLCLQIRSRRDNELDLSLLDRKGKTNAFLVETPSEKSDKEQLADSGPEDLHAGGG